MKSSTKKLRTPSWEWQKWSAADINKKVTQTIGDSKKALDQLLQEYSAGLVNGADFLYRLETVDTSRLLGTPLSEPDSIIDILKGTAVTKSVRDAAFAASSQLSAARNELFLNIDLYNALVNISKTKLNDVQKHLVSKWLRYLTTNGIQLPAKKRDRVAALLRSLDTLKNEYEQRVSNYNKKLTFTKSELSGIPDSRLSVFTKKGSSYQIGTSYPEVNTVMQYADNELVRKAVQLNFFSRGGKENLITLKKITTARKQLAQLLGYSEFLEMTTEKNLIGTPAALEKFLLDMKKGIAPVVKQQDKELSDFIKQKKGNLNAWSAAYYATKLVEEKYDYNTSVVREYFPVDHVLGQCGTLFAEYFGVDLKPAKVPIWHNSVRPYLATDIKTKQPIGYVFLDLFPREGKYSHMCMSQPVSHEYYDGAYTMPVIVMIGNFTPGGDGMPALMSYGEMETLLHEFGHVLHGLLAQSHYRSQSGTNTCVDYVEIPSQFMEYFLEIPKITKQFSCHWKTRQQVPDDLLKKVMQGGKFHEARIVQMQLCLTQLDLEIHKNPTADIMKVWKSIQKTGGMLPDQPGALFPASFGHLASMYGALYWGYLVSWAYAYDCWSQVVSSPTAVSKKQTLRFRSEILATGSDRPERDSLRVFLGRKPSTQPIVKYLSGK